MKRIGILTQASQLVADPVVAYVGPGAGPAAIGSATVLLVGAGLLIVGLAWYPTRLILRHRKAARRQDSKD